MFEFLLNIRANDPTGHTDGKLIINDKSGIELACYDIENITAMVKFTPVIIFSGQAEPVAETAECVTPPAPTKWDMVQVGGQVERESVLKNGEKRRCVVLEKHDDYMWVQGSGDKRGRVSRDVFMADDWSVVEDSPVEIDDKTDGDPFDEPNRNCCDCFKEIRGTRWQGEIMTADTIAIKSKKAHGRSLCVYCWSAANRVSDAKTKPKR
jgi:hypothetical protein